MPKKDLLTSIVDALAAALVARMQKGATGGAVTRRRGKLSAAGRERIRAAQKKRWAAFRKAKAARR
jgi:hypothetical protein